MYESSSCVLGFVRRKHQDWFDENDETICDELKHMHDTHRAWIADKNSNLKKSLYKQARSSTQKHLRSMKEEWWRRKAQELQEASDKHDMKSFYNNLKSIYGPMSNGSMPILSANGEELLTEKKYILKRWAEHFNSVLNRESSVNEDVINALPQKTVVEHLANLPAVAEVKESIKQLSNGKSPGEDGIPAEIFRHGGTHLVKKLTDLFCVIWDKGSVPQQFKDASIVHLYKNKGNKVECDNHRGISLLSIAGKILARVILNRINKHVVSSVYPESQCGFRAGRGTIDMVFSLKQVQEKAKEHHQELYMVFIDLTKAFDTVSREALWKVLAKIGLPEKMINVICSFHDGMMASVQSDNDQSNTFEVTNGTKQGCVLAPVLFALFFSMMLDVAFKDIDTGVQIQFRTSGGLYNQQRFKAKTKARYQLLRDLLFADDCALLAHSLEDIQFLVDRFADAAKAFGLTISIKKTELVHQPVSNAPAQNPPPQVFIDGKALNTVQSFTYLGSTVTSDAKLDKEICTRLAKASSAFGKLHKRLWSVHDVSLKTKTDVYKAVIVPTLLYGAESWAPYRKQIKQLDAFHMRCLRTICNISWEDRVRNSTILSRCEICGIEYFLVRAQTRWVGHVIRMDDTRIPKQLLYGQISDAPRRVGRPLLRYKDKLKENLKHLEFDTKNWEQLPLSRTNWRSECYTRLKRFELKRTQDHDNKYAAAKIKHNLPVDNTHICPMCGKSCRSKAGLASHSRRHVTLPPNELTCITCKLICKSKAGLKSHMRTHAQRHVTPPAIEVTCTICKRVCKSKAGLKSHMRTHAKT